MPGDPSAPERGGPDPSGVRDPAEVRDPPSPLTVLHRADLRRWAGLVAHRLERARSELDALNVFPVPDGDTGTNLALTVGGAVGEGGDDPGHALLVHARGSSGVIASQLVRGWADVLTGRGPGPGVGDRVDDVVGPGTVATALRRGDDLAWAAVSAPVPGTALTVSRAAAEAAERSAATGASLHAVVVEVVRAAGEALERTPSQLPALAAAGVVDAGGAGLLLALQALLDVVVGAAGPGGAAADRDAGPDGPALGRWSGMGVAGTDLDPSGPAYEVMYLLAVPADSGDPGGDPSRGDELSGLRRTLQGLGDSVVVVGGAGLWHVHVHTDDPGAAVEAALVAGRPSAIRITHFAAARQTAGPPWPRPAEPEVPAGPEGRAGALAVVACAAGPATQDLCRSAGAEVVLSAPGAPASHDDVLAAVLAAGAGRVLVLPNDAGSAAVAEQVGATARGHGVTVVVGRSLSQVQVLAALAVLAGVFGPGQGTSDRGTDDQGTDDGGTDDGGTGDRGSDEALRAAAAAVQGCRYGAVARCTDEVMGGLSQPGGPAQFVGTAGREIVAVGSDAVEVALRVVAHLGGPDPAVATELVTVLPGQDGTGVAELLRQRLHAAGGVTVDVLGGGQPGDLLLLGCE